MTDTSMSAKLSEMLTIVLSIRDNHAMTIRWLDHALRFKVSFKVIIADGSDDPFILHEKYKNSLNVKVIRSSFDKDYATWMQKLSNVLNNEVDTEFSMLADNDDFFVFEEVETCISFLLKNKSYACCSGSIAKFELKNVYSGAPNFTNISKLKAFEANEPLDRLTSLLERSNYREIYYDVMYTKTLGAAFKDFLDLNRNDVTSRFMEFYIAVKVLSTGKAKSFDNVFLLRQEDYQSSTSNDLGTWESIFISNWSHMFFNLIDYACKEFEIQKSDFENTSLVHYKYRALFEIHVAEKIIRSGKFNISFSSFLRSKVKNTILFSFIKIKMHKLRIKLFAFKNQDSIQRFKNILP